MHHQREDPQAGHSDSDSNCDNTSPVVDASTLELQLETAKEKLRYDSVSGTTICEPEAPSAPPDGGLWAWLQVLSSFLIFFNTGYMLCYGIFEAYYDDHLHLPSSINSWTGSIQISLVLFMGAFSGRAYDAGYYRESLAIGATLQIFGLLCTSFASKPWQFLLAQGFCQGIGFGCVYGPAIAHASTFFAKKRTIAIALASCGSSAGGALFPLMVQQLLPKLGFAWTIRFTALIVLILAIISFSMVRIRLSSRKSGPLVEFAAFKELKYSLFTVSFFFSLLAYYFAYTHARSYALDVLKVSETTSFNMIMVINAIGIPARLVMGHIANRYFGAMNTLICVVIVAAICMFAWIGVHNLTGKYVWLCFYGYATAAAFTLLSASLAGLTKDLSKIGTRIGMVYTISSLAVLTGGPLADKIMEETGGKYLAVQIWGGVCWSIGAVLLVAANRARS